MIYHSTFSLYAHTWFVLLFKYLVDCGDLPSPINGQARLTETLLGFVATYTCDSGYTIVGNNTRECSPDGTWSDEVPKCVPTNVRVAAEIGSVVSPIIILLLIAPVIVLVMYCLTHYQKKRRTCSSETSKVGYER